MGVSAFGERRSLSAIRHAIATALVFLGCFYYLYGPPVTERMTQAAHDRCNHLTGDTYRSYRLVWRTTTYAGVDRPHWQCQNVGSRGRSWDLGWWAGL